MESLAHSAVAYEAAKERLERKYGGKHREIAINMEEIDQFKPIRPGYTRDVENLADLLDILTINLKEAKRTEWVTLFKDAKEIYRNYGCRL